MNDEDVKVEEPIEEAPVIKEPKFEAAPEPEGCYPVHPGQSCRACGYNSEDPKYHGSCHAVLP